MSECLMAQRGGKYTRGRTITDENMIENIKFGDKIWGPISPSTIFGSEWLINVKPISDGTDFYFGGTSVNGYHNKLVKISQDDAHLIWVLEFASSGLTYSSFNGGRILALGRSATECLDTNGNLLWSNDGFTNWYPSCCFDENGNAYVSGTKPYSDSFIFNKFDINGNLLWSKNISIDRSHNHATFVIYNNTLLILYSPPSPDEFRISQYDLDGNLINTNFINISNKYFQSIKCAISNSILTIFLIDSINGSDAELYAIDLNDKTVLYTIPIYSINSIYHNANYLYLLTRQLLQDNSEKFLYSKYYLNTGIIKNKVSTKLTNGYVSDSSIINNFNKSLIIYYRYVSNRYYYEICLQNSKTTYTIIS